MPDPSHAKADRTEYFKFTRPGRLHKSMNTLQGIIQGIVADEKVNDAELRHLVTWIVEHEEFSRKHPFNEVLPTLREIVADGIVDEEERADLLWLAEKFDPAHNDYYDNVTCDLQELQGMMAGVIADGHISEQELAALQGWLDEHIFLETCWPYDEINSLITAAMKDGKLDEREEQELLEFFSHFSNTPQQRAPSRVIREMTVAGICALCPEIEFINRAFCFTGTSERAKRKEIAQLIVQAGGQHHDSVKNETHYLIIGAAGNPCWAYACYGRKVEDAVNRRKRGQRLLIVHEHDFWDAAADARLV